MSLMKKFAAVTIQHEAAFSPADLKTFSDLEAAYLAQRAKMDVLADAVKTAKATLGIEETASASATSDDYTAAAGCKVKQLSERLTSEVTAFLKELGKGFVTACIDYIVSSYRVSLGIDASEVPPTKADVMAAIAAKMGGVDFAQKRKQQIAAALADCFWRADNVEVKGSRLNMAGLVYVEKSYSGQSELSYPSQESLAKLAAALSHFDNPNREEINPRLGSLSVHWKIDRRTIFGKTEIEMDKVKSLTVYKNGKVTVEFDSYASASQFQAEYTAEIHKSKGQ